MMLLDHTCAWMTKNLALDEALLDAAEANEINAGVLRIWEPKSPVVVLGRASQAASEVQLEFCQANQIPVLRRCSGGATILAGPGCLMYAVVLPNSVIGPVAMLDQVHSFVLQRVAAAVADCGRLVEIQGTSDLTHHGRKFSGNSMRSKRNWFLYHGTLLCRADLDLIAQALRTPFRQPDYRQGRSHLDFLVNLDVTIADLREALIRSWQPTQTMTEWDSQRIDQLVRQKYSQESWNLRR